MGTEYSEFTSQMVGELLSEGKLAALRVTSNSMVPTLQVGDQVLVEAGFTENFPFGEIIVFLREGELITHRYLRDYGDTVLTKGDNSPLPDAPVHKQAILGKVTQIKRNGDQYNLNGKKARKLTAWIGGIHFISANINQTCAALWSLFFKGRYERAKIFGLRVLSFPFRMICRFILIMK